jgi:dTDP-4-dehydrorhamnose reductase
MYLLLTGKNGQVGLELHGRELRRPLSCPALFVVAPGQEEPDLTSTDTIRKTMQGLRCSVSRTLITSA